jgi:hypothetical protein
VVANPPSGSTFPVGTNMVTVIASDGCGDSVRCTFKVIVNKLHVEVDQFTNTVAEITIQLPTGGSEVVTLSGPTTVNVFIGPNGEAGDSDGNGLDDVATEMVQLDLQGNSSLGPVAIHLDPAHPSVGKIEEEVNNTPGILDVPPFTPTGKAHSFFDVFLELEIGGAIFHPATPVHMETVITHKPPAPGDTYTNVFLQPVPVLDANGNPTGVLMLKEVHTPNPPIEVDSFGNTLAEIVLQLPSGAYEAVQLAGPTTVHVFIPSNGAATDTDGNGLDDVMSEMVQLDLTGNSSLGPVSVHLDPAHPSMGRIEERTNNTPGILDVPPFTPTGSANSFFDIFLELEIDGVILHPSTPLHMESVITHKPPAPGDTYVNPFTQPVDLLDANGRVTGVRIVREVHVPNPNLAIICPSNIIVAAAGPAGTVVTYPNPVAAGACSPPPTVVCSPPSGSVFPVGTNVVTCVASGCGSTARCLFEVIVLVKGRPFPNPNLPPTNSAYISPRQWHALYANGIVVSNVIHRRFLQSYPPPPAGGTNVHTFGSEIGLLVALVPNQPLRLASAPATVTVQVANRGIGPNGEQLYDTEMLALDMHGGTLPSGVMIRESPSKASLGKTTVLQSSTGFLITSFFDVFTEISLDGGQTWSASDTAGHMELHLDPGAVATLIEPRILSSLPSFGVPTLPGLRYIFEFKDSVDDPNWYTLTTMLGTGQDITVSDTLSLGLLHRFYRVRIEEDLSISGP